MSERWQAVLLLAALVVLAWAGMAWGWRRRGARQGDLPAPASPPASLGAPLARAEGTYVGTVVAGQWLERVVAHSLGARARAEVSVHPSGLLLDRDGAAPLWVPREDLTAVRRDTGLAGKVTETGGLVVWTWRLGDTALESGLRPRYAETTSALLEAIGTITEEVA